MTRAPSVAVLVTALTLGLVGSTAAAPVPSSVQHRIAALSASPVYLPTWVPPGFIFIGWKQAAPPANGTGNGSTPYGQGFTITFAHAGRVLLWEMQPGPYNDCVPRPFFDRQAVMAGRRVYYVNGNHGDSGFVCVRRVEFMTWADHLFSPSLSMRIAASARRAR